MTSIIAMRRPLTGDPSEIQPASNRTNAEVEIDSLRIARSHRRTSAMRPEKRRAQFTRALHVRNIRGAAHSSVDDTSRGSL